ncbi:ArgE/DapE family deacylase [Oenococcus kitaharae]|uniref:Probable succinyl-diaminopimelate desuccinylase n=1 Tax=Oenococcus kitaharae DSM 17330 TaxID=1045004 RepID=G9WH51_9LACO|nr:ArgE/DapE family deacylase [Oenococcus kitaharae]EHN59540.1 Acetylornithine deacetylase [Oenococcus kitaharae DSM 17330]OEY83393.1 peptidase M20 [Oenococcus kitaharae]OEY85192.1 peptidase M20 [Oenococcus kitaharae]OEY86046.1 peptidase M20 [Oenococcus kitaharae]
MVLADSKKIEIFQKIVQFETDNKNEAAVAAYISDLFSGYDNVQSRFIEADTGRKSLVLTIKGKKPGNKVLAFSGHEDTVSAGDLSTWKHDPFKAEIQDNILYGRGADDMKGGLSALTSAALAIVRAGSNFSGSLKLIGTVGEETSEIGAKQVTQSGALDDVTALILGEPRKEFQIGYTNKGVIDYRVFATGKSAHSSRPENGINAINALRQVMDRFDTYFKSLTQKNEILGSFTNAFTTIEGGKQLNQIPDSAVLGGNMRTIPEVSNDEIIQSLEQIIDQLNQSSVAKLKLEIVFPELPLPVQKVSDFTRLAQKAIQEISGFPGSLVAGSGANEASEYIKGTAKFPILIFGPESDDCAHAVDEHLDLKVYLQAAAIYEKIAIEYLQ